MSLLFGAGSPTTEFSPADVKAALFSALDKLGSRKKVLAVPPDFTRMHSMSGQLTEYAWNYYGGYEPEFEVGMQNRTAPPAPNLKC